MSSISYRSHLPLDPTPLAPVDAAAPVSTLGPLAPGDVLVGATLLDDPADRQAGRGRILHYDSDLKEKGVLWVRGTTHLVCGLAFAPDGVLWALDPWAWTTVRVDPAGHQLPNLRFAERAYSGVHFMADRTLLFTELLAGDEQPAPGTTHHRPLPGHRKRLGDGHLWRYTTDGEVIAIHEPEMDGGKVRSGPGPGTGCPGIRYSVLSPDQARLCYVAGPGSRLMQFDLVDGVQLADLRQAAADGPASRYFGLAMTAGGLLLVSLGDRIEALAADGTIAHTCDLPGAGWSVIAAGNTGHAYVGNPARGELARVDPGSGRILARVRSAGSGIAGIAVVPASGTH